MTNTLQPSESAKRNPPTIVDVAAEAGVAVGTVSRFLNGHPIRNANRTQIARAIEELGYTRNAVAASMKTSERHIVGLLVPNISEFHAGFLEAINRKIRRTGRAVMSYTHNMDSRSIMDGVDFFRTHRVDAIIMDGMPHVAQPLRQAIDDGLNVVLYDNDIPGLNADRVFVNNRQASRHGVKHILELGHTRIGVINGVMADTAAQQRFAGYIDAIIDAGLERNDELIVSGEWGEAGGHEAMRRLMSLDEPPTAIYSANYNMTIGALIWCHENNISIPNDLSIVSFDDVPAFRLHQPGITAIGQPTDDLAEAITTLLTARFENRDAQLPHRELTVRCQLNLRGSTGRPRATP